MDIMLNRITKIIIACLLISALLHVVLFSSDSEQYRNWVTIQIVLQLFGVALLAFVIKRKLIALITFLVISTPFIYINAVYVNYAHEAQNIVSFIVFWLIYGYFLYKGWVVNPPNKAPQPTPKSGAAEL